MTSFLARNWRIWTGQLVCCAAVAAWLPPLDDEVYYWTWSQSLQLSYYDHPGMTAWLIWLSTRLFGNTVLGLRFPACCCLTWVFAVIGYLTQSPARLSEGPRRIHPLLFGVLLTPLFTFGAVVITPDAPLLAAWSAYLLWLIAIQERLADESRNRSLWRWWLLGGILLGLGGLSKYTMALAVPAGFASFLFSGISWRKWFAGYASHGILSAITASPIFLYNWKHDFEPLRFQWRHAMHDAPASLQSFSEFWGVQWLLFGTLPLVLVPWSVHHLPDLLRLPRLRVCTFLYLLPLSFFVYKSVRTELEGNWALVMFVSVWPVAAVWYDTVRRFPRWRWLTSTAFLPPAICVVGLAFLILSPVSVVPVKSDRLNKQRGRWDMVQRISAAIHKRGEVIPTFATTYQMTALLRFWGIDARQEADFRASVFTFPPQHIADVPAAYVVTDRSLPPGMTKGFGLPKHLGVFPTIVRGQTVSEYHLWRFEKLAGNLLPSELR